MIEQFQEVTIIPAHSSVSVVPVALHPPFANLPVYHDNSVESTISYERTDHKQVDLCLYKPDETGPAELLIGVYWILSPEYPSQFVRLSLPEARFLRDLLNRPEVQVILDEE